MKKLLSCLLILIPFIGFSQCDIDLLGYDPITHQVSVAIINGENCGCNEFTTTDGSTCGPDNNGSVVNNNETINHFVFGLHIYEDYTDGPCSQSNYHPGWTFAYPVNQSTLNAGEGLYTGDTLNVELNTFFDWECLLGTNLEGDQCWEMVVWQINLSQTVDIIDFPEQYWTDTCGTCMDQTQMYPDIDLSNNTLVWCPDELPPSPLYPGCTDEEADNFDINATFDDDSCEYTILGCQNPVACNYNSDATVDDGSCIVCDTLNGEELCNAYHNSEDYWDYYVDLFNCPTTGDINMDNLFIVEADCDVYNLGVGCNEGIRFHTDYTNVGQNSIDEWKITWTGPNGFIAAFDYGINSLPPYNVPLPPGINANTINTVTTNMVWEEGDILCATATLINQVELTPENNTICTTLPAYPVCIPDCTDPLASNYNMTAECTDNDLCEYLPIVDVGLDTILYITGCFADDDNAQGAYWLPTFYLTNYGEVPITEFCITEDILGTLAGNDTTCFDSFTILPGETYELLWPYEYEWGVLSVRIIDVNGPSDQSWNDFGLDNNVGNNMYVQIITDEPDCTLGCTIEQACNYNPDATINDGSCDFESCVGCMDLEASNFDPNATISNPALCIYDVLGCMDVTAINYNPFATVDDGSCIETIIGCMIPDALNYNPLANVTCEPIIECCIFPIEGCTDETANNYEPNANVDDGSCTYDIFGCTDTSANNYNSEANVDDGSCTYDVFGCLDMDALNYNPLANIDDGSCEYDVFGCTDSFASNYNPLATVDDGSCVLYLGGCTDGEALNYNPQATDDDGSCVYDSCSGLYFAPNTFTPNNDGVNDGWSIVTDSECWLGWNVKVYNRWGQLVWESTIPGEVWSGGNNGGSYYVADGVYYYLIEGVGYNPSHTFQITGHITIFR